jgi:hopanoid biosynthesis associated protein HpnK
MKYLIINADDFGLSENINAGIARAAREGIVKSASLLVNAKSTLHAVELARHLPQLDLGIHVCIVQGKPLSNPKDIPSLIGSNGYFLKHHLDFLIKLWLNKISLPEVESECRLQIQKALGYNLRFTHIDTHQHLHIHPKILKIITRLASAFKIPYVRYTIEPPYSITHRLAKSGGFKNIPKFILSRAYSRRIHSAFSSHNILRTDSVRGMYTSGALDQRILKRMISRATQGTTEIICHPALKNEDFSSEFPGGFKNFNWENEFKTLINPELKYFAARENVQFISFKDIPKTGIQ